MLRVEEPRDIWGNADAGGCRGGASGMSRTDDIAFSLDACSSPFPLSVGG